MKFVNALVRRFPRIVPIFFITIGFGGFALTIWGVACIAGSLSGNLTAVWFYRAPWMISFGLVGFIALVEHDSHPNQFC